MTDRDGRVVSTWKIVDNGFISERWNLVIMGDGYTEGQMRDYDAHVRSFVAKLFTTPPFDAMRRAVNVYKVNVISTDSGADEPRQCGGSGAAPRTYFDASFCGDGHLQRLLVVNNDTVKRVAKDQKVDRYHVLLVIVNTPLWGGSGGGPVAVCSRADGADEVALHEIAHSAFGLHDEYEYFAGCGIDRDRDRYRGAEPQEPNVTTSFTATNKWRDLIAPTTKVPTMSNPDCTTCDERPNPGEVGTVGTFEGAASYHCGVYRPEYNCLMRGPGVPFCAVCARTIRRKLRPSLPAKICSLSRIPQHVDVFWPGSDGRIWSTWWQEGKGNDWSDHKPFAISAGIPTAEVGSAADVAVLARVPGHVDVFWRGTDGRVWSTWWQERIGWAPAPFPVAERFPVLAAAGGVAALSRVPEHVDLFWRGEDGRIWSAWWHERQGWAAPFPVAEALPVLAAAGNVAALSRVPEHVDLFWRGEDGRIWSMWWHERRGWAAPFPVLALMSPLAAAGGVTALSRKAQCADVFWPGSDGRVWTVHWQEGAGWDAQPSPVGATFAVLADRGADVTALSRVPEHIDVFWRGADGRVWSNWWHEGKGNGWQDHAPFPLYP